MTTGDSLRQLIGQNPNSLDLATHVTALVTSLEDPGATTRPDVKAYPDAVYFNYYKLGMSILFTPKHGYKPTGSSLQQLDVSKLLLDSIDLYNVPNHPTVDTSKKSGSPQYSTYPISPVALSLSPKITDGKDRPNGIEITPTTTGKDFVGCLGEPDRKGGGAGPSSGSIGIWCEWAKDGLMVEFGGDEARGPQAWERGKDAIWKVMTIFAPK